MRTFIRIAAGAVVMTIPFTPDPPRWMSVAVWLVGLAVGVSALVVPLRAQHLELEQDASEQRELATHQEAVAQSLAQQLEGQLAANREQADRNTELRRELVELRRQVDRFTRKDDPDRGDPVARALVERLLKNFDDVCFIGPDGCESHFRERNCSVAWLRSWVEGHLATPGLAGLAITMTGQRDSTAILIEALDEWADRREADGAREGLSGQTWRHKVRLGRAMATSIAESP